MLKVRLADNNRLNVEVDGRYFNKTGTSVTVGDLPPGKHKFTIYTLQQGRRGRTREEAIYTGRITTHGGYVTIFTFDPISQSTDVQEQEINSYAQSNPAIPRGRDGGQYDNTAPQVNNNNTDQGNDNKYIDPSSPVASPVAPEAIGTLTDAKSNELKTKAAAKKTDTEKMNVLKEGLKDEKITTAQVGAMMDWFNFESSKVDFAKWAYANTVDKENFGTLDIKLTYKNYEDELAKFLKDNGQ
jgi:hypothetical protein